MSAIWTPSRQRISASNFTRFQEQLSSSHGLVFDSYNSLHAWSVAEPDAFWSEVWDFCGFVGDKGETAFRPGASIMECSFFPEAQLNVAETLLKNADGRDAIIFHAEEGRRVVWSRAELRDRVSRIAAALAAHGVTKGNCVAGIVPNMPE